MVAPIDLADALYAALLEDDVTPFLALCAPDVTVDYPAASHLPYGGTWRGRASVAEFLAAHEAAEEIVVFDPIEMVAGDGAVFVLGRFEGVARPTSVGWTTRFIHVLTFRDGLLERWESFFDTAAAVAAHRGP